MSRGGARFGAGRPSHSVAAQGSYPPPPPPPASALQSAPDPERKKFDRAMDWAMAILNDDVDGVRANIEWKAKLAVEVMKYQETDQSAGKSLGKKAQRLVAANSAGEGTEWGNDLQPQAGPRLAVNNG